MPKHLKFRFIDDIQNYLYYFFIERYFFIELFTLWSLLDY